MSNSSNLRAVVDYRDAYVEPLIKSALLSRYPDLQISTSADNGAEDGETSKTLYWSDYEEIDFEKAYDFPQNILVNAYVIRKALIRKHFLSNTILTWGSKHPLCALIQHSQTAVDFELDYAEFLDDALVECFELRESLDKNASLENEDQEWWILKPSMSDRGQGIRLFSTFDQLQDIFEQWEADMPDSDEEEDQRSDDEAINSEPNKDYVMTSQLRHFVAQRYVHPPLFLPSLENRKFHIRTYVLAVGALKVYVYRPMLALFAANTYAPPWTNDDLAGHLTNTCLQDGTREGSVRAFWDLEDQVASLESLGTGWKDRVFEQICTVTGELFESAARGQMVHFQPLPNAFEIFGLDFLVDDQCKAWLLEVNAFPDFKQTGDELQSLISELFEATVDLAVKPFFDSSAGEQPDMKTVRRVLDIDLGRR